MLTKRILWLLPVLFLIGCSTEPTLNNIRTAKDQGGTQPSGVFSKTDTVFVVSDLANGVKGNLVSSKWYASDVQGIEPDYLLDEAKIEVTQSGPYTLHFDFPPPPTGWLAGTYKVDVYFNDALAGTVTFKVQ